MKSIDFESIGVRIKGIRSRKKITQDQLSEMIGSDRTVIARIENGNQGCSIDYLVKIANALEISSDALLIDSLDHPNLTPDEAEISGLLSDCSDTERTFFIRSLNALKDVMKGFTIK